MWNALIGVDTFFVIGGCLLAYHTMKQLDKTKGGNASMWIMFYVHRYIRFNHSSIEKRTLKRRNNH